ncbi:hypothetical protein L7F22_032229 [Adiantum nelumboides]|nr:hypothetical protein [Adiantum nelumboides]
MTCTCSPGPGGSVPRSWRRRSPPWCWRSPRPRRPHPVSRSPRRRPPRRPTTAARSPKASVDSDARELAARGYVVQTWTARGFGASGGSIGLDDPDREVADASRLVDRLAARADVQRDADGDPRVGVTGGSYGGGLALLLAGAAGPGCSSAPVAGCPRAGTHRRVPPPRLVRRARRLRLRRLRRWGRFRLVLGRGVLLRRHRHGHRGRVRAGRRRRHRGTGHRRRDRGRSGRRHGDRRGRRPETGRVAAGSDPICGRFARDVCAAYGEAARTGRVSPELAELLRRSSPATVTDRITAPTLLVQGEQDTLFGLDQADANARQIAANGTPVSVLWFAAATTAAAPTPRSAPASPTGSTSTCAACPRRRAPPVVSPRPLRLPGPQHRPHPRRHPHRPDRPRRGLPRPDRGLRTRPDDRAAPGRRRADRRPPTGREPVGAHVAARPRLGARVAGLARRPVRPDDAGPVRPVPHRARRRRDAALRGAAGDGARRAGRRTARPGHRGAVRVAHHAHPRRAQHAAGQRRRTAADRRPRRRLPRRGDGDAARRRRAGAGGQPPAGARPHRVGGDRSAVAGARDRRGAGRGTPGVAGGAAAVAPDRALRRRRARRRSAAGRPRAGEDLPQRVRRGVGRVVHRAARCGARPARPERRRQDDRPAHAHGPDRAHRRDDDGVRSPVRPGAAVLSRIGAFVEGPGFLPHLSGAENLRLYWEATGRPPEQARMSEALEIAGLGDSVHRRVGTYSQGMRQRLAIAQAMLGLPELLVLDEPTNGLDPPQIHAMRELLRRYAAGGRTVLVSSHLLSEVEQTCSEVVVMHRGTVVAAGTVAELMAAGGGSSFTVDDTGRARAVLAALDGVTDVVTGDQPGVVHAHLDGTARADAVAALVSGGVAVSAAGRAGGWRTRSWNWSRSRWSWRCRSSCGRRSPSATTSPGPWPEPGRPGVGQRRELRGVHAVRLGELPAGGAGRAVLRRHGGLGGVVVVAALPAGRPGAAGAAAAAEGRRRGGAVGGGAAAAPGRVARGGGDRLRHRGPGLADRGVAAVLERGRAGDARRAVRDRAAELGGRAGAAAVGEHRRPAGRGRRRGDGLDRLPDHRPDRGPGDHPGLPPDHYGDAWSALLATDVDWSDMTYGTFSALTAVPGRPRGPAPGGPSDHDHPAVDHDGLAGHVVGVRAGEVGDEGGDVVGGLHPAQRDTGRVLLQRLALPRAAAGAHLLVDQVPHVGADDPRAVRVHGDPVRRQLLGRGLGEGTDGELGRRVVPEEVEALVPGDRRGADDLAAGPPVDHHAGGGLQAVDDAEHVDVEDGAQVVGCHLEQRLDLGDTGVRDHHVQTAELLGDLADHRGDRVGVGDVGRVGHRGPARRADLLGDGGGAVGVPVVDGDGVPVP